MSKLSVHITITLPDDDMHKADDIARRAIAMLEADGIIVDGWAGYLGEEPMRLFYRPPDAEPVAREGYLPEGVSSAPSPGASIDLGPACSWAARDITITDIGEALTKSDTEGD